MTPKPMEEMTEREVLAEVRRIKREASKRRKSFSSYAEEQAYYDAMMKRVEEECGVKFKYGSPRLSPELGRIVLDPCF